MGRASAFSCLLISFVWLGAAHAVQPRVLTLEDRVAGQRAIEEVYWRHRIWPDSNPEPKPQLSTVMSADAIRVKVEAYLRASSALEAEGRPITRDELQAELDRMAKSTRAPHVLRELFAALEEDAFLGTSRFFDTWEYSRCDSPLIWYRDADGDGSGSSTDSALSCSQPAAHVATGNDCDDTDPTIYPNAPEVNDGRDNQCSGDSGHGVIDEISGILGFTGPNNFCWVPQAGATSYQLVRSTQPDFTAGCTTTTVTDTCLVDPFVPPGGQGYFYLVRALTPHVGSWGQRSDDTERMGGCLPP